MKTLPLFYYPSTWVWVDDDENLLTAMVDTFSKTSRIIPFQSANACVNYFKNYNSLLTQHSFLKNNTEDENFGVLQRTPMNFDVNTIVTLLDDPQRHEEITAMVIDYHMPKINGFELAKLTYQLLIPKILLTGNTEENKAIQGFNDNLIDCFVRKNEPDMVNKLSKYLKKLSVQYFEKMTQPLLSYLEIESKLPLSDPVFVDFFEIYCEENNVKEYYLIDKQGSFLCINAQGKRFVLVMHSEHSINAWIELHGAEPLLNRNDLRLLKNNKKIPFFGVGKEAWQFDPSQWSHNFYTPNTLQGRKKYFWARINENCSIHNYV